MTVFFTSDLHLGHANIIQIASRPFANVDAMNERLLWDVGVDANAYAPISWEGIRDGLLI